MARGSTAKQKQHQSGGEPNPEMEERRRLKTLAHKKNMLADTRCGTLASLSPLKTVTKRHGKDIVKKSQRKNLRFLFSFPGLMAPIGGGKIGELKNLGTKNPILYLDFPRGQMKLFGTIVYPENRYLTLQFPKGGKSVVCEDYFDTMIVFSDAWWIGNKDQNPEEAQLEFPKDFSETQYGEYDFKGGAGSDSVRKPGVHKAPAKNRESQSPVLEPEDDLSEGVDKVKEPMEVTPVRHSERTAQKKFNFLEVSSGDDSGECDAGLSVEEKPKTVTMKSVVLDFDNEDALGRTCTTPREDEGSSKVVVSCKRQLRSSPAVNNPEENGCSNRGSLVQASISTLFKKAEEKKPPRTPRKVMSPKVSRQKSECNKSKRKTEKAAGDKNVDKVTKGKAAGNGNATKKDQTEVDDDEIEEFSTSSQDADGSDEDWAA